MCIAQPGRVLAVDADGATVELAGRTRRASLLMTPDAAVGEWVLVAAGSVVRRIDAEEASDLMSLLERAMATASASPAVPAPQRPASPEPTRPGGFR